MRRICVGALLLAVGCVHIRSVPIGSRSAPLAPCEVRIEHVTTREAEQRYTEVGRICVSYTGATSTDQLERQDEARQQLTSEACTLGGDVVVPLGLCTLQSDLSRWGPAEGFEYHVYRDAHAVGAVAR